VAPRLKRKKFQVKKTKNKTATGALNDKKQRILINKITIFIFLFWEGS
jgi:hypothetical protein